MPMTQPILSTVCTVHHQRIAPMNGHATCRYEAYVSCFRCVKPQILLKHPLASTVGHKIFAGLFSPRSREVDMLHSIRIIRSPPASYLEKIMNGNSSSGGVGRVRLVHATAGEAKSTPPPQDAAKRHEDRSGDVMSHSFGDGYSTRSNDDGFGGVYGGNDPDTNDGDRIICEHPDYDKTQGSEVAEKEKARHQKTAES